MAVSDPGNSHPSGQEGNTKSLRGRKKNGAGKPKMTTLLDTEEMKELLAEREEARNEILILKGRVYELEEEIREARRVGWSEAHRAQLNRLTAFYSSVCNICAQYPKVDSGKILEWLNQLLERDMRKI